VKSIKQHTASTQLIMADQNMNQIMGMIGPMLMMNRDGSSTTDKIIGMILVLVVTQLTLMITSYLKTINLTSWKDIFKTHKHNCCFHSKAKMIYQNECLKSSEITRSYNAIQKVLYNKLLSDKANTTSYYIEEIYGSALDTKIVKFINPNTKYLITQNITLEHTMSTKVYDKDNYNCNTYTMTLTSLDNDYVQLKNFVAECIKTYDDEKLGNQRVFIFDKIQDGRRQADFDSIEFDTTKTFDNMFFEQKKQILDRIDKFNAGEKKYRRLGIPYTLGFMFHGAPGTGKTSVIKSIANYTQRHLVIIPVKKITSITQLKNIFMEPFLNNSKIPNHKRLYVFEEIDCGEWASIVRARHLKQNEEPTETTISKVDLMDAFMMNMLTQGPIKDKDCENASFKKPESICLGDILELLDGVVEMPGRMIIMTSNHPEQIDPALMRPGRIDMSIEFKKLRRQDVMDMYQLWFDDTIPSTVYERLKDYTFTQAEIGNIFALQDKKKIHRELVK
jgi:hypothetical protein